MQQVLGVAIGSAIGAVAVGCGTSSNCAPSNFTPTPFDVTFQVCGATDAGAADAAAADGGPVCFDSCIQACAQLKPASLPGDGVCMSSDAGAASGTVTAHCQNEIICMGGRKIEGLDAPTIDCEDALGAYFARLAWLEAAAVGAFRRLVFELRAHGAPDDLIAAAKASARDEVRHARLMARLAKKHGATVPRVVVEDVGVRDLESIARENAVEGCVGETFGAALATWHGEHATHADVRDAMRAIASDELRHAALGWAVAAWAETRLSNDARERVRTARNAAARDLLGRLGDPHERALGAEMHRELWAA